MLSQEQGEQQLFVTDALSPDLSVDGGGRTSLPLHCICILLTLLGMKFCSAAVRGAVTTDNKISPLVLSG